MASKALSRSLAARPCIRPSATQYAGVRVICAWPSTPRKNAQVAPILSRDLKTSACLKKKKSRADRDAEDEARATAQTQDSNPRDFSTLHSEIEACLAKLSSELGKLRPGGRFNPELLENLRVKIRASKQTERLGDLAQVLPKGGRNLNILVGERDHVKPIISSIQTSELNLQPLQDSSEPLQLNILIPPPTAESRALAKESVGKAGEAASMGIRAARGVMQKKLRNMELKKLARPDDLKKAHKELDKIAEKAIADIKKATDAARKSMEMV
ncbi:hypothetical protein K3495_g3978 [Podosphaera aphanis]|nr:hypothetical protein K3495_g3978 [Podosphaera aphanis]